ncbi:UNVERIFIED_CONTAM: polysaccharide biosynthesis protein [Halobacillus marinus]|uniref:PssD/Cps14F family polysaccharide biosynthesis glycosyltransferase n=1 Tax=Halobacillus sp. BAB-2008 TaxID=1246484 RepID=UPI0002A4E8C3|nr:PssD/Cps14F family polysaccharide biosynthesis glycosyltransferase [Halobacillus sp. BAB-2008]ELK48566.1 Oligosaccharide biosynthesis protein Alg14 like protein [Halobacillus sp. BAB-2008]
MNKQLKVGLVSSTGGHFSELMQLVSDVSAYDCFIVTEQNKISDAMDSDIHVHFLEQQERRKWSFFRVFMTNIYRSIQILRKEKPDVIISTGAGATVPLCLFAKWSGRKVIYIESFANITAPTMTGRILYRFSDKFYIQWEELKKYYPKAEYRGKIF